MKHPVVDVKWVHRDKLKPNDYNPNSVAPPELKLLKISILEDGWTQPIVVNPDLSIVDGFHRWTVSGDLAVYKLTDGKVPVVVLPAKDRVSRQMSTIRHNRARGVHGVLPMADIVEEMLRVGTPVDDICERLQMETEEVVRLASRKGIPRSKVVQNAKWSKSWTPK